MQNSCFFQVKGTCKLCVSHLLHPSTDFFLHASLLVRLRLLLSFSHHSLQLVRWHQDIWQSHEHVQGVRASPSFITRSTLLRLVPRPLRCVDATGVEGAFPSRGDLIFQCLSAEMVKYSASVDGVEENGRGPLRAVRNPEWRTGCLPAEQRWLVRPEEMCCTPWLCWWCGGVDVARAHGKVGRLLIRAIRLGLCIIKAARTLKNATCLPNAT